MGDTWRNAALRFGPLAIWLLAISLFSTGWFSSAQTEHVAVPVLHWLLPGASPQTLLLVHYFIRKLAHLTEFGVLGLLLYHALKEIRGGRAVAIACTLLLAVAFAGLDEFHQIFVPGRTPSVRDVGLDGAGATLVLALRLFLSRS